MEHYSITAPGALHINDFNSQQSAHLRARERIYAAERVDIDEEQDAIERALRGARRRHDEPAVTELLLLRARSHHAHANNRAAAAFQAALDHATKSGNLFWQAIALVQRATSLRDPIRVIADLWEGVQILGRIDGAGIHLVRARLELARSCLAFDPDYAGAQLDGIATAVVDLGPFECNMLGGICRELGRLDEALLWFGRALELSLTTHPIRAAFASLGAGIVHADMGKHQSAVACYRQALQCRGTGAHLPRSTIELARSLAAIGESAEGERVLRDFVADPDHESWTLARRAAYSTLAGLVADRAPDEAIEHLEEAILLADIDADNEAALDDSRRLLTLLRNQGRKEEFDARIMEYVTRLEGANEANRIVAEERKRTAIELHRMTARFDMSVMESRLREYTARYTSQELARQAATTAAFSDTLQTLNADLRAILESGEASHTKLASLRRVIDRHSSHEIGLQSLEIAFANIDPEFRPALIARFPDLSNEEVRVCMLLRMRLGTADIARYLNRSPRSVENHRFRIRRKLTLAPSDSLPEALATFA